MPRFRKRPVEIDAIRWTGDNITAVTDFMHPQEPVSDLSHMRFTNADDLVCIQTLEGLMVADRGDWIIRGVQGELYPCKPVIFAQTYSAVETPGRARPAPDPAVAASAAPESLTPERFAGIRARVEADYPTVCTGCGHGRLVHAIPAPSPCAVRGWLAPGWRCECPGWQHPYLPVGRHDGRQDRRDAVALLAEVARLAEVERQARADQADRHDDLAHALGRDDAAVGWDELISIAASAAQAESESQVRAKARADGTGLLHCETPARGDTITERGHQMACTPPVLPWVHRLDAREGLWAARDDLISTLEDGGHLDARADRLLNAYRAAVLREGAEAVFALDYDDQVKGGEDIGSIREAWDLGTIHATELLGRLADAAADSTCGHDADDRCEDCGRCPCAVCATDRVCRCECMCPPPALLWAGGADDRRGGDR